MDTADTKSDRKANTWWRPLVSGVFVAVAAIALLGAVVTRYVERNILDTPGYIAVVGPLPQDPAVAAALADFTTGKIFDKVSTEAEVTKFLPPKLAGLAGPLSNTLEQKANQTTKKLIQSDSFNGIWIAANQTAQKGVVRLAESKAPQGKAATALGSLNLSQLAGAARQRIGGKAVLTDQQLDQAATVRINLQQRVERLRTTVGSIKAGARTLPFVAVAFLLAAVAIAYSRRHTVRAIFITLLLLGMASLITFKVWSGSFLGEITNATYQAAATTVYEAFYGDLRLRLVLAIALGVLLITLAAVAGPYTWAQRLRHALAIDRFTNTRLYRWSINLRHWVARYELWLGLAGLAGATIWLLALSVLTPSLLVVILSILTAYVSLIHLIARPSPARATS